MENNIAFPSAINGKFIVTPINEFRASKDIEKIRLATENHPNKQPEVFMLTYGNRVMRRARAAFACNFFACGGYQIIDNPGFSTAEEGVAAALKSKADIIVLCSSDEEYERLAPEVNCLIAGDAIMVVAGAPACMDELKSKGIENFVHLRSDIVKSLKEFHSQLGIKL